MLVRAAFHNWTLVIALSAVVMLLRRQQVLYRASALLQRARVTMRTRSGISLVVPMFDVLPSVEVFAFSEYDFSPVNWQSIQVAVDCGANVGAFTLWLTQRSPCRVVAIEPNPPTYRLLRTNVRPLAGRVSTVEAAIGGSRGTRTLFGMSEASGTSFFGVQAVATWCPIVSTVPLQDILDSIGAPIIDLLKMDIEGAEEEVFRSINLEALQRIRTAVIECHPGYGMEVSLVADKLRRSGMRVVSEDLHGTSLLVGWRE